MTDQIEASEGFYCEKTRCQMKTIATCINKWAATNLKKGQVGFSVSRHNTYRDIHCEDCDQGFKIFHENKDDYNPVKGYKGGTLDNKRVKGKTEPGKCPECNHATIKASKLDQHLFCTTCGWDNGLGPDKRSNDEILYVCLVNAGGSGVNPVYEMRGQKDLDGGLAEGDFHEGDEIIQVVVQKRFTVNIIRTCELKEGT
jgi:ribosomal protein S27E